MSNKQNYQLAVIDDNNIIVRAQENNERICQY